MGFGQIFNWILGIQSLDLGIMTLWSDEDDKQGPLTSVLRPRQQPEIPAAAAERDGGLSGQKGCANIRRMRARSITERPTHSFETHFISF